MRKVNKFKAQLGISALVKDVMPVKLDSSHISRDSSHISHISRDSSHHCVLRGISSAGTRVLDLKMAHSS